MTLAPKVSFEKLASYIRDVPDFPKPGIIFKDITPLLAEPAAFACAIDEMVKRVKHLDIDRIVAIESRGFVFGAALAYGLKTGFVMVRKPKKLPFRTTKIDYALEYGTDSLEMHIDSLDPDHRVLVVDDVLATGGTARATAQLVELMGSKVCAFLFLSELRFLEGRARLKGYEIYSLLNL